MQNNRKGRKASSSTRVKEHFSTKKVDGKVGKVGKPPRKPKK